MSAFAAYNGGCRPHYVQQRPTKAKRLLGLKGMLHAQALYARALCALLNGSHGSYPSAQSLTERKQALGGSYNVSLEMVVCRAGTRQRARIQSRSPNSQADQSLCSTQPGCSPMYAVSCRDIWHGPASQCSHQRHKAQICM